MENEISTLEELQELINTKPAILAYFYNDNCAPCVSLRPKVIEMKESHFPLLDLYFINSKEPSIPANFAVYDYPSLLIFFDKKEYIRVSKYVSTVQLAEQIQRYYDMIFGE